MATEAAPSGNFLADLRGDIIAAGHAGGSAESAAPEPATDTPSEAAPAESAAPADGSTPSTEKQPQPTGDPAGSTPGDGTAKALSSDVSDPEAKRYLEMYGGDLNRALKEALATNNRAAELARQKAPTETPSAVPKTDTPQATPATTPTTAPETKTAAPVEATPEVIQQHVASFVADDKECSAWREEFNANATLLNTLKGTEIPKLKGDIQSREALIVHPGVDEFVKDQARNELRDLRVELALKDTEVSRIDFRNRVIDQDFRGRVNGYGNWVAQQLSTHARDEKQRAEDDRQAEQFIQSWPNEFDSALSAHLPEELQKAVKADPEFRNEIHEAVKARALARPGRIEINALGDFMREAVTAEAKKIDRYHRFQARQYAERKSADTDPQAPTGAASTAPPQTPADIDPIKVTRQMMRERMSAMGATGR